MQERHLSCAMCLLLLGADLWLWPSWQMSMVQDPRKTWLATGSLLTVWWRKPISGAEIAPCLPALAVPHLPLCLRQGERLVCSRLALLWYSLNPLFCEWARLGLSYGFSQQSSVFFFLSLAITQFGLLSHISSFRLFSGHSGPVLILSMQPAPPCPAPACRWWTWVSRLLLHWELRLGAYSVGLFVCFFPPSYVALWDSKTPHRPTSERVSCCLETSPPSRLPPKDRSPSLILVSPLVFYILSYLILKRMGCFCGCLVSSASIQKLFCGSCSAFKWSFDEFVGEKVVSPSYSSAILGLHVSFIFNRYI